MVHRRTFSFAAPVLFVCSAAQASTTAGPVQQVIVTSSIVHHTTQTQCSAGWVNLPGASVRVIVPSGANQLLTARFTASVRMDDTGTPGAVGLIRIVTGAKVLQPDDGGDGDQVTIGDNQVSPAALERSALVAPGSRLVVVQFCMSGGDFSDPFQVNTWHLAVEAAPVQ